LVAIGANLSAFFILVANSFMQQPVGYVINEATGRAEMVDFFALIKNPTMLVAYPHTIFAGLSTAAFFVIGISAYHLMRDKGSRLFKKSFKYGVAIGLVSAVMVGLTGHTQAQHMVETQPMKMAAAEMLYESEDPAGLSIITIGGEDPIIDLRIPGALSFLAYDRFSGEVEGINPLQEELAAEYGADNYVPPVGLMYWSFRIMVFGGSFMVLLAAVGIFLLRRKEFVFPRWLGVIFLLSIALPYLANSFGWIMTEVGRAPWTVYGILKLSDSVSTSVGTGMLWLSLIGYVVVYGALMVADVYLLSKFAKAGYQEKVEVVESSPSFAAGSD
jgi:cytochrome d ubiquinol oxidase subunit I